MNCGLSAAGHGKIAFARTDIAIVKSSEKPTGAGELGTPPVAAAVGNALFCSQRQTIRETLGARLTLSGKRQEARTIFEDDLRRNPNNPRSLVGLSVVLDRTDARHAAQVNAAFRHAWSHADTHLWLDDL